MDLFTVLRNIYLKIQKNINVERITNSEIDDAFGEAAGTGTDAQDYVIEHGTITSYDNHTWTYRKWASGIAECWGRDASQTSIAGNKSGVTYLAPIFNSAPVANVMQSTTNLADSWLKYSRVPATPSNGSYYINWYVYASAANYTIELEIYAIGTWK